MQKKRILIVDDVAEYVQSLGRALSLEYDIVKTFTLEQAKKAMDNTVSLALVDIRLSEEETIGSGKFRLSENSLFCLRRPGALLKNRPCPWSIRKTFDYILKFNSRTT